MKSILYSIFSFLLMITLSCKEETQIYNTENNREVIVEKAVFEDFEGLYFFENSGSLELVNDAKGLIDVVNSDLIFPNLDGSIAVFSISGKDLPIVNDALLSDLKKVPNVKVQFFKGNVEGSPDYNENLDDDNSVDYEYSYEIFFDSEEMLNIQLNINQTIGNDTYLVYTETLTEK